MTPNEKAIELVYKFIKTNGNSFFAKDCALIAVDEIIKANPIVPLEYALHEVNYWQEVRNEIQNIQNR